MKVEIKVTGPNDEVVMGVAREVSSSESVDDLAKYSLELSQLISLSLASIAFYQPGLTLEQVETSAGEYMNIIKNYVVDACVSGYKSALDDLLKDLEEAGLIEEDEDNGEDRHCA